MKREHSVRTQIFLPLTAAVLTPILFFMGVIFVKGIIRELDHNEFRILHQKVVNRADYLEEDMLRWADIDSEIMAINQIAESYYEEAGGDFSELETKEGLYTPFLRDAAPELIQMMRHNFVNGAFLVLSTAEPSAAMGNKPCIYLRDTDAIADSPEDNSDLLAKRMPAGISRELNIAIDSDWKPNLRFGGDEEVYDFFSRPYGQAWQFQDWDSRNLGYWSDIYTLSGDVHKVISYSVPLKLSDGTIYGVLGIDITVEHLKKILAYQELHSEKTGAYLFGALNGDNLISCDVISGPVLEQSVKDEQDILLRQDFKSAPMEEVYLLKTADGTDYYASVRELHVYDSNSPFEGERRVLCGAVRRTELLAFANEMDGLLKGVAVLSMAIGLLIAGLTSLLIAGPLVRMAQHVRQSDPRYPVSIPRTSNRELNELGDAIGEMSRDIFDVSLKFARIIRMASVEMGGFEVDSRIGKLFVTEGFFSLFGQEEIDYRNIRVKEFFRQLEKYAPYITKQEGGETLYELDRKDGKAWIRLRQVCQNGICYGLAENVTREILEIQKIEYERDYDTLTGLLNRRAFQREVEALLDEGSEKLGAAAMLMVDLDNLKLLNDTYGHDWGDRYIQLTAASLKKYLPGKSLVARMSGDEFLAFLSGAGSRESLREDIRYLERSVREELMVLPDQKMYRLRMSGGLAWYGDDANDYARLVKYADFAMYKIKNSVKGRFCEFERESYMKEAYLLQNKEELNKLIEQKLVEYYFQPIVNVRTGEIFGYEALMRSGLKTITSVQEILALARQEYKLGQIERMTWFQSMQTFMDLRGKGLVSPDCRIFINTIPNQIISQEDCETFESLYWNGLKLIVQEITEDEKLNREIQEQKRRLVKKWGGQTAIDDYGTGYNSQSVLMQTSPEYVKVDMSFVREIESDDKKQDMVRSTVAYAHTHGILVIAEGVETFEEVGSLVELGVDFLQGYYYARPEAVPGGIDPAKAEELAQCSKQCRMRKAAKHKVDYAQNARRKED